MRAKSSNLASVLGLIFVVLLGLAWVTIERYAAARTRREIKANGDKLDARIRLERQTRIAEAIAKQNELPAEFQLTEETMRSTGNKVIACGPFRASWPADFQVKLYATFKKNSALPAAVLMTVTHQQSQVLYAKDPYLAFVCEGNTLKCDKAEAVGAKTMLGSIFLEDLDALQLGVTEIKVGSGDDFEVTKEARAALANFADHVNEEIARRRDNPSAFAN